jgi:predicted DsbA family dithiol-disulfide isomerase
MRSLAIDLVSDVVCPWCLIGSRRLAQALESFPDVRADVTYHPFLLDPTLPREGVDLRERLTKKYGVPAERLFGRVESEARASGIPLDFEKVRTMPSTVAAHTLIRAARPRGTQRALAEALFRAYFLEGRDVGDPNVLASVAGEHRFEPDEALSIATDPAQLAATKELAEANAKSGIGGVPFFRIGRLGISGAQPVDTLREAISRAVG